MLRIAICDDDEKFAEQLEDYIFEYTSKHSISADVFVFTSGEELLKNFSDESTYDILFLDIELGETTGIELGKQIREKMKNETTQIVFVSSKENYAIQLFDIRPLNFMVKPVEYKKLEYVLNEYDRLYKFQHNYFEYNIGKQRFRINEQSILYFQSQGKKIQMITQEDEKEFYGKLSDVLETLNEHSFIAVHKSYVINMRYVSEYGKESILMINGDVIPVSRAMRNSISQRIIENEWGRNDEWV